MGWNGSDNSKPVSIKRDVKQNNNALIRFFGATVLIGILAAGVYFYVNLGSSSVTKPEAAQESKKIAEHDEKSVPDNKVEVKSEIPAERPKRTVQERVKDRFKDGKMTPARLALMSHSKTGIDKRPIVEEDKVAEVRLSRYSNRLHQELAKYAHPGMNCDTPDGIDDKMALELCEEKIKYNFDDSDEVLAEKKAIENMVEELKEYMANGGHAQQYFMELMERQDAEYEAMQTAKKHITELCKNGDVELAQEALDRYNAYLNSKGLPEVKPTPLMEHYLRKGTSK